MIRTLSTLLAALALFGFAAPAQAAQAYLVSCNSTSSPVTGRLIYVGEYQYGGRSYYYTFTSYCPNTVEIY